MDFWQRHGWLFLIGCAFFPRITTLFFSAVTFGFWHIVGWVIAPHFLVAILATTYYWDTNPVLVTASWAFAFMGTGGEAKAAKWTKRKRED
jgi:hypothetical protein